MTDPPDKPDKASEYIEEILKRDRVKEPKGYSSGTSGHSSTTPPRVAAMIDDFVRRQEKKRKRRGYIEKEPSISQEIAREKGKKKKVHDALSPYPTSPADPGVSVPFGVEGQELEEMIDIALGATTDETTNQADNEGKAKRHQRPHTKRSKKIEIIAKTSPHPAWQENRPLLENLGLPTRIPISEAQQEYAQRHMLQFHIEEKHKYYFNLADSVGSYLSNIQGRYPKEKTSLFRDLEKLVQNKAIRKAVQNHCKQIVPMKILNKQQETELRMEIGYFLATIAYQRPCAEKVAELVCLKQEFLAPTPRQSVLEVPNPRVPLMEIIFHYTYSGGSLENLARLGKVVQLDEVVKPALLRLKHHLYYDFGYSSYHKVVDSIITCQPQEKQHLVDLEKIVRDLCITTTTYYQHHHQNDQPAGNDKVTADQALDCFTALFSNTLYSNYDLAREWAYLETKWLRQFNFEKKSLDELVGMIGSLAQVNDDHQHKSLILNQKELQAQAIQVIAMVETKSNSQQKLSEMVQSVCTNAVKAPALIHASARLFSLLHKSILITSSSERLTYSQIYQALCTEYEENWVQNFKNRQKARYLLAEGFPHQVTYELLQSSFGKSFVAIPVQTIEQMLKDERIKSIDTLYDLEKEEESHACVRTITAQLTAVQRFGIETVMGIDAQLHEFSRRSNHTHLVNRLNPTYLVKKAYRAAREVVYEQLQQVSGDLGLLTQKEYLIPFMKKITTAFSIGSADIDKALGQYFFRGSQLLASLPVERDEIFQSWVKSLLEAKSYEDLMQQLSVSDLPSRLSGLTNLCHLRPQQEFLRKFASLYSHTAMMVIPEESTPGQLQLPLPQKGKVFLPEMVNHFHSSEDNQAYYTFLTVLQAGVARFGLQINGTIEKFDNPGYARRLAAIAQYVQTLHTINEIHPKLGMKLEDVVTKVQAWMQEHAVNEGREEDRVLQMFERAALFGASTKKEHIDLFINQQLMPILHHPGKTIPQKVEEMYNTINENYPILTLQEKRSTAGSAIGGGIKFILTQQTGGEYASQQIYFYPELGDAQQTRVIVKTASAVANDRVQKIKLEQGRSIGAILSQFEQLKPERVTTRRRVYDGELDEEAYSEMLLEVRAGHRPDSNVYTERRVRERDIAVVLSINQPEQLGKWLTDTKRVVDFIRPVMVYFNEALKVLDDPLAIVAYTSRGAHEVFMNVFKDFEENGKVVDDRIGLLSPLYQSRTGAIYRHIAKSFGEHPAKRKLHFDIVTTLASDNKYSGETAMLDTKEGVRHERAQGIELYAFCLDPNVSSEQLREIYGAGRFVKVTHPDRLPEEVLRIYRLMTL